MLQLGDPIALRVPIAVTAARGSCEPSSRHREPGSPRSARTCAPGGAAPTTRPSATSVTTTAPCAVPIAHSGHCYRATKTTRRNEREAVACQSALMTISRALK